MAYRLHGANMQRNEAGLTSELRRFSEKHSDARAAHAVSIDMAAWWRWRIGARRFVRDRPGTAEAYWRLARITHSPRDAARGTAMLLGGERAMALMRRLRGEDSCTLAPPWLEAAVHVPPETLGRVCR
jgi:hypothetical protein